MQAKRGSIHCEIVNFHCIKVAQAAMVSSCPSLNHRLRLSDGLLPDSSVAFLREARTCNPSVVLPHLTNLKLSCWKPRSSQQSLPFRCEHIRAEKRDWSVDLNWLPEIRPPGCYLRDQLRRRRRHVNSTWRDNKKCVAELSMRLKPILPCPKHMNYTLQNQH